MRRYSFALLRDVLRLVDGCVEPLLHQVKGSYLFIRVIFTLLQLTEVHGNFLLFFIFIRVRLSEMNVETDATFNLLMRLAKEGAVAGLVLALLTVLAKVALVLAELREAAVVLQAEA